jgi:hypothetical protein
LIRADFHPSFSFFIKKKLEHEPYTPQESVEDAWKIFYLTREVQIQRKEIACSLDSQILVSLTLAFQSLV